MPPSSSLPTTNTVYAMAAVASNQQWAAPSASSSTSQQQSAHKSARRHADMYDRFYGHRQVSELCEAVISALFACPLDSASSSVGQQTITAADGTSRPTPRLAEFIAYALHRTRLPEQITFQALFLLRRLKCRFPAARGSSGHRLFISALMLASKSSCDDTYSNKSWTIVSQGLFSLREVNQMERELFGYLGYRVNVEVEELDAFTNLLKAGQLAAVVDLGAPAPVASAPMVVDEVAQVADATPTKAASIAYTNLRAPAGYTANPAATYSMQSSAASSTHQLSPSMASMSSSRGSFSSASGYSMAPSPAELSHSESGSSSRASPDTPPSEFDASPWTDDGKATFAGQPSGTFDNQFNYYEPVKQQQQYFPQQYAFPATTAVDVNAARNGY